MAVTRSAEGHKIVQRLLDQIADERTLTETSGNTLKKIKRGLGALLFSPDSLGYIDIIEKGLSQNKTGVQILRSVASRSEKVVKSYSPLTGAFEAHHIIALNSLRDAFIKLPPAEQDEFLKMLDDKGWKIGDDPKQLMNTVFTRESHLGQSTQAKPSDVGAQREVKLTMGENIPREKGMDAHAGKPYDPSLQAKPVTTAKELFEQFDGPTGIAGRSIDQAQNALLQDEGFRAYMETKGFPLDNVTPEIIDSYYNDPIKLRQMYAAMQEAALEAEAIPLKIGTEIKSGMGVDVQTRGADPELIGETVRKAVTMRGMAENGVAAAQRTLQKMITKVPGQAFGLLPIIPVGMQLGEVEAAEKSGDPQKVAEETAQLGLEASSSVFPAADLLNIGTDVYQGYRGLREQGVTHGQMLEAALGLGKKAIQRPDKAVAAVAEGFKGIPEMTLNGFKYGYKKLAETLEPSEFTPGGLGGFGGIHSAGPGF